MNRASRVIEGILTTRNPDGSVNIAPMGPHGNLPDESLVLRPFRESQTYHNLLRTGCGVFHTTDQALLLAQAVLEKWLTPPKILEHAEWPGMILADACDAYPFQVVERDDSEPRAQFFARVTERIALRPFGGWNRAQFAVLELAICTTRLNRLTPHMVQAEVERARLLVEKTAGPEERWAFDMLKAFIQDSGISVG